MYSTARVVVIGAGLAGLAAASTLLQSGYQNVIVLEAMSKAGGRVHTVQTFGSSVIELGANWIHGQEGNPLYALAREHGLLPDGTSTSTMCLPSSVTPEDYFFREDGRRLSPEHVGKVCALFGRLTAKAFAGEFEDKYLSSSFGLYLDEAFAAESPHLGDAKEAWEVFEWCKRSECTDEASSSLYEVSLSQLCHYISLEGGFFNALGPGGYLSLLDVLLKSIPQGALVCDKPVRCIRWTLDGDPGWSGQSSWPVMVVCEDGQEYNADHVIVTASLGFLKDKALAMFEPALPSLKLNAIDSLGFGTVDKIFLKFSHRFWPDDCAGIQLVWEQGPEGLPGSDTPFQDHTWRESWYKKICGFDTVACHPTVLCGWITGQEAEHMESLSEEEVGDMCVRLLRIFTPWSVPKPSQVLLSRWGAHPYVRGSYTYIPCGVHAAQVHQALMEPLPPDPIPAGVKPLQVLFAGEATHLNFYSTAHGAYISGVREAQRLIDHCAHRVDLGS